MVEKPAIPNKNDSDRKYCFVVVFFFHTKLKDRQKKRHNNLIDFKKSLIYKQLAKNETPRGYCTAKVFFKADCCSGFKPGSSVHKPYTCPTDSQKFSFVMIPKATSVFVCCFFIQRKSFVVGRLK